MLPVLRIRVKLLEFFDASSGSVLEKIWFRDMGCRMEKNLICNPEQHPGSVTLHLNKIKKIKNHITYPSASAFSSCSDDFVAGSPQQNIPFSYSNSEMVSKK